MWVVIKSCLVAKPAFLVQCVDNADRDIFCRAVIVLSVLLWHRIASVAIRDRTLSAINALRDIIWVRLINAVGVMKGMSFARHVLTIYARLVCRHIMWLLSVSAKNVTSWFLIVNTVILTWLVKVVFRTTCSILLKQVVSSVNTTYLGVVLATQLLVTSLTLRWWVV